MDQILLFLRMFASPRSALLALPSDRIFVLAWLAPAYFSLSRAYRSGRMEVLEEILGGPYQALAFFALLAAIFIPLGALLLRLIVRLFGKRLTVRKLMNLYGYSLAPRTVVLALFTLTSLFVDPFAPDAPRFLVAGFAFLGILAMALGICLYIYGIAISPSEPEPVAQQEIDLPLV